jgi:hypothetical protein
MPKRVKQRSLDVNEAAFQLVQQSTHEPGDEGTPAETPKKRKMKPPKAVSEYMAQIGSRGGRVSGRRRKENLSPERRSEIAHQAAQARWKKKK